MCRLIIFLILLMPELLLAQHKERTKKTVCNEQTEYALARKHYQCFYNEKHSIVQRNSYYPFNVAAKIEMVRCMAPLDRLILKGDTVASNPWEHPLYIKFADGSYGINRARVFQSLILNRSGIDSLTDLLYNYGYTPVRKTGMILIDEPNGCYEPRNAIFFYNKAGKVVEYIEYCFTCSGFRHSSEKIKNYVFCIDKYEMLRKFFFDRGLTPLTHLGY